MMNVGRKNPGRRRIFKPPDSLHFGFAADTNGHDPNMLIDESGGKTNQINVFEPSIRFLGKT